MKRNLMLLCGALLISCSAAAARDIFVRAGGPDGDGSKEKPLKYLWKAVDQAVRGDVIHVAAGTYEGKNGCGHFSIKTPNLSLVGGYDETFTHRSPFQNFTILQRAADYKGSNLGLPEGIIAGADKQDHSNLVVDGFVLDGKTRNSYQANGDINAKGSYHGELFEANAKNVKIRNCILLNPYGDGIYCMWAGEENEVVNCFVVNTFHEAVSTRSAQTNSKVMIRNNTIFFCWFQPGKGGGTGVLVGNQGEITMQNNVIAFVQTEDEYNYGKGVVNLFGNTDTVMKGNIFFQCQGGYYFYMDNDKKNLLVWKPEELKELNGDAEHFMLAEAADNSDQDPQCKPDKDYFEKFSNFVAGKPGKLNMDFMNQWRRSVGLNLQAEPGSARKNWGMAYPLSAVVPNLVSGVPGKGARTDAPLEAYVSKIAAAPAEKKDYATTEFDAFKKGAAGVKDLKSKAVAFQALIGSSQASFLLNEAPRGDYDCFMLVKPGANPQATRDFVYGYFLKGSEAHQTWQKLSKKADRWNKKGGVVIKGTASYLGSESYSYPVGVIVDEVSGG